FSLAMAEGGGQDHQAVVPAHPLAERTDGGIGAAAAAGPPRPEALRARLRFRLGGSHLAGTTRRLRRRCPRKRQPPTAALAQGRYPRPAARKNSAAEHDQAD